MIIGVGVFYMAYTIIPIQDFTNPQYYTMIAVLAVFGSVFTYYMIRAIQLTESRLKLSIQKLIHFIFNNTKVEKEGEMWEVLNKVADDS